MKSALRSHKPKILIFVLIAIIIIVLLPRSSDGDRACFEDNYCVKLEIRDTPQNRASGLMFREYLDESDGMLFIFEDSKRYNFWMKNMLIPLDIIFLDENKEIVHISKAAQPCTEEPCALYTPEEPALYVVEVIAGFSDKHNLAVGQKIKLDLENT